MQDGKGPVFIGLVGKARVGKTTIAALIQQAINQGTNGPCCIIENLADPLKWLCPQRVDESKEQWRPRLQSFGAELAKQYGDFVLVELARLKIAQYNPGARFVIIPDVRRIGEFQRMSKLTPHLIKINCNDEIRKYRFDASPIVSVSKWIEHQSKAARDATETEVDLMAAPVAINNTGNITDTVTQCHELATRIVLGTFNYVESPDETLVSEEEEIASGASIREKLGRRFPNVVDEVPFAPQSQAAVPSHMPESAVDPQCPPPAIHVATLNPDAPKTINHASPSVIIRQAGVEETPGVKFKNC